MVLKGLAGACSMRPPSSPHGLSWDAQGSRLPSPRFPTCHKELRRQMTGVSTPLPGGPHPAPRGSPPELRPETWTRLMVAVMRLPVGPDPGILPGSGP